MAGKPVATVGSMHVCPMCSGTVPHVGGPISQGDPTVLINGKPVATIGSMCTCVGPPDVVAQGEATVLVNGVPIATVGALTAHGGSVTVGEANVIITTSKPINLPRRPRLRTLDRVGALLVGQSDSLREAEENQDRLEELTGEPYIFNIRWEKEEQVIREGTPLRVVQVSANVANADDGEEVSFNIARKAINEDGEMQEDVVELSGIVQDKKVTVEWEVEEREEQVEQE